MRLPEKLLVLLMLVAVGGSSAWSQEPAPPDPSGGWASHIGVISLILHGDGLSFSYSAVFGPTAHLCDGAGVAGLVEAGRYEYTDEEGTVAFLIGQDQLRMEVVSGIASFCGAGWAGDVFTSDGFSPPESCTVTVERSHFHVVAPISPERRRGYVILGDVVEAIAVRHEGGEEWMLARFVGPKSTIAGLLAGADLRCRSSE